MNSLFENLSGWNSRTKLLALPYLNFFHVGVNQLAGAVVAAFVAVEELGNAAADERVVQRQEGHGFAKPNAAYGTTRVESSMKAIRQVCLRRP